MQSRAHTPDWLRRDFLSSPSSMERQSRRLRVDSPLPPPDSVESGFSLAPSSPSLASSHPSSLAARILRRRPAPPRSSGGPRHHDPPGSVADLFEQIHRRSVLLAAPSWPGPAASEDGDDAWEPSPNGLREVAEFSCNGERLAIRRAQNVAAGKYDVGIRPKRPRTAPAATASSKAARKRKRRSVRSAPSCPADRHAPASSSSCSTGKRI